MIEQRVSALEDSVKDIKSTLGKIDDRLRAIETNTAEIKGKLSAAPTSLQMIAMMIATWAAGATIVFTMLRSIAPIAK